MSTERPKQIRVLILNKRTSIHPSKSLDNSKNSDVNKIVRRQRSLPQRSLVPVHYTTHEKGQTKRIRHIIHTNLASDLLPRAIESNSNSGINRKQSSKYVEKSVSSIIKISDQQSQEKDGSQSIKPTTTDVTIASPSSITANNLSRNVNKILSESPTELTVNENINNENQAEVHQTPIESRLSETSDQATKTTKNKIQKKRHKQFKHIPCRCSLIRIVVIVFTIFILLAAFAALIVALYGIKQNTTTTVLTNVVTVSVINSTASTMPSSLTTSTTTSTTTTAMICGSSCLTQSWLNSSGIIAFWPFENSFADSTNVYNGTPSLNVPNFVPGYVGQTASFNASAKNNVYTSSIPLNNVSFTVDAWIYQNGQPNPTDYSIVGLCTLTTNDNCLHLSIRTTNLYFGFYGDDLQSVASVSLNLWTHVAFVFFVQNKTQAIYINGFLNNLRTATGALENASGNFTIGTNQYVRTPNNSFQGYIDQLSINGRPKSSCEILEIATLAAHFKFDTSSPLIDSGPNTVTTAVSNYLIISGYKNQAISFSGASTSYFQGYGLTSFGISNQAFSIAFWIRPQTLSGTLVHLSTSSSGTGSTCFPLLGFASNGTIVAQVLISNSTIASVVGPILSVSSSWTAIVETWSSTNGLKLYVNNTLVSSITASTFLASGTTPNYLTFGNCLSGCGGCLGGSIGTPGPFTGAIDDLRIYNRELTSNDICTLYSY